MIPRDYQLEPVRDFLVHVDFLRVGKNTELTVEVPVHFVNQEKSPGLKKGGVLNIVHHTLDVTVPGQLDPRAPRRRSHRQPKSATRSTSRPSTLPAKGTSHDHRSRLHHRDHRRSVGPAFGRLER